MYLVQLVANHLIDIRFRAHIEIDYFLRQLLIQAKTCSKPQCLHYFLWLCVYDQHQLFLFLNLSALKIPMINNWLPFFVVYNTLFQTKFIFCCLFTDFLLFFANNFVFFCVVNRINISTFCCWFSIFCVVFLEFG